MFNSNKHTTIVLICCLVYVILIGGCSSINKNFYSINPTSEPCSILAATSKQVSLPNFLEDVYPAPGSVIKHDCYIKGLEGLSLQVGIYATIVTEKIVETGDNLNLDAINERIELKVHPLLDEDNSRTYFGADTMELQKYDDEGNLIATWGGPTVWKSMPVELASDEYIATIRVQKTSGDILEYSWSITIEP